MQFILRFISLGICSPSLLHLRLSSGAFGTFSAQRTNLIIVAYYEYNITAGQKCQRRHYVFITSFMLFIFIAYCCELSPPSFRLHTTQPVTFHYSLTFRLTSHVTKNVFKRLKRGNKFKEYLQQRTNNSFVCISFFFNSGREKKRQRNDKCNIEVMSLINIYQKL